MGKKTTSSTPIHYEKCYKSHPPLQLGKWKIYGGNADTPIHEDADIYVSLQAGSTVGCLYDPWEAGGVIEVKYPITDCRVPDNLPRFKKMITWLCNQVQQGNKVHVGCIGGHGRTGVVLTAIVAELLGEKDAIQYVRKNYCDKAVESEAQVEWLMKHYGVSKAPAAKGFTSYTSTGSTGNLWDDYSPKKSGMGFTPSSKFTSGTISKNFEDYQKNKNASLVDAPARKVVPTVAVKSSVKHINSPRSIWGKK
jgi:hypothetical protein